MKSSFQTNFLSEAQAEKLAAKFGTPLFVYSRQKIIGQAQSITNLKNSHRLLVRYAMKANPHPGILNIIREQGIQIDASSGYEALTALKSSFDGKEILLTSQQLPNDLVGLLNQGVQFNATSLHQLETYGKLFPGSQISVRLNPGIGSGHSSKTNVGGVTSSFGIWHEYIPRIIEIVSQYKLTVKRVHTHIGSGTNPAIWHQAARISLDLINQFSDATILNLGGGFKVARMDDEQSSDMVSTVKAITDEVQEFERRHSRRLDIELEPGTYIVANAGILLSRVDDIVDTGTQGFTFLKLDTGMNDILRPSLYGAQHPMTIIGKSSSVKSYVVVGHNCESGDLLTPTPGNPDVLLPRQLNQATIGDLVIIGGVGAYCASMSARGYNGFPTTQETFV